MSLNQSSLTLLLGIACLITAAYLTIERGGVIAWLMAIGSIGLLWKVWRRPGPRDFTWGVALVLIPGLLWFGTYKYVISTWESGEVVELAINTDQGVHHARLWVMNINDTPVVYYDAPPQVAAALLAGDAVEFTRAGQTSKRIPLATPVDELADTEANQILNAMQDKYASQNHAATLWYALLGRPADRQAMVVHLHQP